MEEASSAEQHAGERRLTVVPDELQATMVCSMLREHDIRCMHRRTAAGGIDWGAINVGMSGAREVLVDASDYDRAFELLQTDLPPEVAHADEQELLPPFRPRLRRLFAAFVLIAFGVPIAMSVLWQLLQVLRLS